MAFLKPIWITLRAANYTSQAMNDASKGLTKVQMAQNRLAKSSVQLGLMYVAMGAMALQGMIGVMQFSERGKQVMTDFSEAVEPAMNRLSDAFANVIEPLLKVTTSLLNMATAHPVITQLAAIVAVFGAGALIALGVTKALMGGLALLGFATMTTSGQFLILGGTVKQWIALALGGTGASLTLAAALQMVAISAGAGLGIFLALEPILGALPAALFGVAAAFALLAVQLWLSAHAMSILTWGLAAIAGTAAIAGAMAMASNVGNFGSGTTFVRRTGTALVHEGEVVYNPRTQSPREIFNDVNRGERGASSQIINITIENVHTKADIDDLDEVFGRKLRLGMRSNR